MSFKGNENDPIHPDTGSREPVGCRREGLNQAQGEGTEEELAALDEAEEQDRLNFPAVVRDLARLRTDS